MLFEINGKGISYRTNGFEIRLAIKNNNNDNNNDNNSNKKF